MNTFEAAVAENFKAGLNRTESLKKAVAEHPDLYEQYLERLKAGCGRESLRLAFEGAAHERTG